MSKALKTPATQSENTRSFWLGKRLCRVDDVEHMVPRLPVGKQFHKTTRFRMRPAHEPEGLSHAQTSEQRVEVGGAFVDRNARSSNEFDLLVVLTISQRRRATARCGEVADDLMLRFKLSGMRQYVSSVENGPAMRTSPSRVRKAGAIIDVSAKSPALKR